MKKRKVFGQLLGVMTAVVVTVSGAIAVYAEAEEQTKESETETALEAVEVDEADTADTADAEVIDADTCVEGCTGENCDCSCHMQGLYDRIIASASLDEIYSIFEETPLEELEALSEEQKVEISKLIESLEPAPKPAVVIPSDENPVVGEIITPTVTFTDVAPFGDPIVGKAN